MFHNEPKHDYNLRSRNKNKQPKQLTREEFKEIGEEMMERVRKSIVITNQLSGYKLFHNEEKYNDFVDETRRKINKMNKQYGYSLANTAAAIKRAGVGRCWECRMLYAAEMQNALQEYDVTIMFVEAGNDIDHTYLIFKLLLKGETTISTWRGDAWDPALHDMTERPDGTVRNEKYLVYGTPVVTNTFTTKDKDKYADPYINNKLYKFGIEPAKAGAGPDQTPFKDMLKKHGDFLYSDYTVEDSIKDGVLSLEEGEFAPSQLASPFQTNLRLFKQLTKQAEKAKEQKAKEQEAKERQPREENKYQFVTTQRPYRSPSPSGSDN